NLPSLINEGNRVVTSLLEQSVDLPGWLKDGVDSITDSLNDITLNFGKWFVQFFQSVVQGAFIIVLVPFFFLFMLNDHDKFLPFISSFFSGKKKNSFATRLTSIYPEIIPYIQNNFINTIKNIILSIISNSDNIRNILC